MPPRKRPQAPAQSAVTAAVTLQPYLRSFDAYLAAECGLARNTILAYGRDLQRFMVWFTANAPARLGDIEINLFSRYLEQLHTDRLAASSVARHLVSIKMFFRYLMLEGVIEDSVVELVNSPKLWQQLPKVLSPDMVDRLIASPGPSDRSMLRDRALLAILYATGCRISEVCSLRLRDVQLTEGYCRCLGKGSKERMVSLNPVATGAIEAYLTRERPAAATTGGDERLFLTRSGRPLSRIVAWRLIKRYAQRIGASSDISPHTLRHSFATHLLAGGAEIRALQELLGHASIRTTQIYTQVEHSRLKTVHERCHPRG